MEDQNSIRSKTIKSFFWSGSSNFVLQIFTLLFGVLFLRLLSREEVGLVALLTVFTLVATTLQESGFLTALINRKRVDPEDYNAVFWFNVACGTGLYVLLFFGSQLIANFYGKQELLALSRFSFLAILFSSFSVAHNAFLLKNLKIKQRSISSMLASILSNLVGLVLVLWDFGYWGFAAINVVYQFVIMVSFWWFSGFRPKWSFSKTPIKEMLPFSTNILATNLLNQVSSNLFVVLLGKFYNVRAAADLSQGQKWATLAQSVITGMLNNVTQVVLNEVTDAKEEYRSLMLKILQMVCFIAFASMFLLGLIADDFILILVTEKWVNSVPFLRLFSLLAPFLVLTFFYTQVVLSKDMAKLFRNINLIQAASVILLLISLYPFGAVNMVICYCALQVGWMLVWQKFVSGLSEVKYMAILKIVVLYSLVAAVSYAVGYFTSTFLDNNYLRIILKSITFLIVYAGLMYLFNPTFLRNSFHLYQELKAKR